MYIDTGDCRALVIEAINWLHYINYEAIACSLSGWY